MKKAQPLLNQRRLGKAAGVAAGTRKRILDSAERLFAERGFEATSIRDIIGAAGVNIGAINYHFGTKQQLIAAIFCRRVEPVNRRRLALLAGLKPKTGGQPPTVEALLEALIRPAVECGFDRADGGETFLRLTGRFYSETNVEIDRLLHANFQPIMSRFTAALLRVSPQLSRQELWWRLKFTFGALHHVLLTLNCQDGWGRKLNRRREGEELTRRIVRFAAAGLRSPVVSIPISSSVAARSSASLRAVPPRRPVL